MSRQETAGEIVNRAAVEIGLARTNDPFSSTNEGFTQLVAHLNAAGIELSAMFQWEDLTKTFTIDTDTDVTTSGGNSYADLPDDYDRLITGTGWDLTNDVAVAGPLSAQEWAYLYGRDLANNSIYVSFRINNNKMQLYPSPPPASTNLQFYYISRNWARLTASTELDLDYVTQATDVVGLDPQLMVKMVKVKWLDAKGLPSQAARIEFENMLGNRRSNDKGGRILNAGRGPRGFPYLNGFYNLPDTNFGV